MARTLHVGVVIERLLARLYRPLDTELTTPLTNCILSDRVSNTTAIQEQEQLWDEYQNDVRGKSHA